MRRKNSSFKLEVVVAGGRFCREGIFSNIGYGLPLSL